MKNQPTRRLIQLLESARTHWSLKTSSGTGPVYWSIKCPFPNRSFNHNYCRVMGNYLSWVNRCAKSTMNCGPLQFPLNIGVRDDVCTAMFSQVPSSTRLSRWAWFPNIIQNSSSILCYPLLVLVLRICRSKEDKVCTRQEGQRQLIGSGHGHRSFARSSASRDFFRDSQT